MPKSEFLDQRPVDLQVVAPEVGEQPAPQGGRVTELCARPLLSIRTFEAAGLRHVVLWNQTFLGDPTKVRESFHLIDEVLAALKG